MVIKIGCNTKKLDPRAESRHFVCRFLENPSEMSSYYHLIKLKLPLQGHGMASPFIVEESTSTYEGIDPTVTVPSVPVQNSSRCCAVLPIMHREDLRFWLEMLQRSSHVFVSYVDGYAMDIRNRAVF